MTSQNAFLRFFRGQNVQPWDDIAATYMDNCQDFPHSFVKGADVRTKPELYAEGSEMLFFHRKRLFFSPSKCLISCFNSFYIQKM